MAATTVAFIEERAFDINMNLVHVGYDAREIAELTDWAISQFDLRSGVRMNFETVQVTKTIEQKPRYTAGFDGQLVDTVIGKTEVPLSSVEMVLRKQKGKFIWKSAQERRR